MKVETVVEKRGDDEWRDEGMLFCSSGLTSVSSCSDDDDEETRTKSVWVCVKGDKNDRGRTSDSPDDSMLTSADPWSLCKHIYTQTHIHTQSHHLSVSSKVTVSSKLQLHPHYSVRNLRRISIAAFQRVILTDPASQQHKDGAVRRRCCPHFILKTPSLLLTVDRQRRTCLETLALTPMFAFWLDCTSHDVSFSDWSCPSDVITRYISLSVSVSLDYPVLFRHG